MTAAAMDGRRTPEEIATSLCHLLVTYADFRRIKTRDLARRANVDPKTITHIKHARPRHFPNLLTFVKLLAAADLEIQIVRVKHGLTPDDPTADHATTNQRPTDYPTNLPAPRRPFNARDF